MPGGPQTKTFTSAWGGATYSETSRASTRPRRPAHAEPAGSRVSVVTTVSRGCASAQASRASTARASSRVLWLARTVTAVSSPGEPRTAWSAWSMGVTPEPPAIMARWAAPKGNWTLTFFGTWLKSTVAPMGSSASRALSPAPA